MFKGKMSKCMRISSLCPLSRIQSRLQVLQGLVSTSNETRKGKCLLSRGINLFAHSSMELLGLYAYSSLLVAYNGNRASNVSINTASADGGTV